MSEIHCQSGQAFKSRLLLTKTTRLLSQVIVVMLLNACTDNSLSGRFSSDDGSVEVTLVDTENGVRGLFRHNSISTDFLATLDQDTLVGSLEIDGQKIAFEGYQSNETLLIVRADGVSHALQRRNSSETEPQLAKQSGGIEKVAGSSRVAPAPKVADDVPERTPSPQLTVDPVKTTAAEPATVINKSNYPGMWRAESDEFGMVMLNLADGPNGSVVGLMLDEEQVQYNVAIWPEQGHMVGGINAKDGEKMALLAQLEGEILNLDVYPFDAQGQVGDDGVRLEFKRYNNVGASPGPALPREPQSPNVPSQPRVSDSGAVQQLQQYLTGRYMLLSWRNGSVLSGKSFFFHTHYCSSGRYAEYVKTVKKNVVARDTHGGWQSFGTWRVIEREGQLGVFYQPDNDEEEFLALEMRPNGPVAFDPKEFTPQGRAEC